ncbi:MAG: hypothetical protein ABSG17_11245 [Spirochaetia bacterium]|jgi:hypothetical protein
MSGRGKAAKTALIENALHEVLEAHHPMTVRQAYYQLVAAQVIPNSRASYQKISGILVELRKDGTIPWEWVEDRLRRPRAPSMWEGPKDFAESACRAYRRDVWSTQPEYFETWLEKDALSGIFEDVLEKYGVTLNVGRGYDGWDSIRNAADRFHGHGKVTVLYFGDFDPSGEDMARSLRERLAFFGVEPELIKVALTAEDIARYNLPPDPAKLSDTRAAAFIREHGDVSVELDALPVDVLRERIVSEVEARLDIQAITRLRERDEQEREQIRKALSAIDPGDPQRAVK